MPGFTAETSLHRAKTFYRTTGGTGVPSEAGKVVPQAAICTQCSDQWSGFRECCVGGDIQCEPEVGCRPVGQRCHYEPCGLLLQLQSFFGVMPM